MKRINHHLLFALLVLFITLGVSAFAQITPSQDSYTNTADPTTKYGTATTLGVVSSTTSMQTTYIQFDLSSIPSGYTGSNVAKATLKLYVNSVTAAGSFNIDFVNGSWSEKTIDASLAPALGNTIASSVALTAANVHDFVLLDVTTAVQDWLNGSEPNDGVALVANSGLSATFDSKENTAQSQPAELDIVYASGNGTITGVTTGSGSGLTGGGTSGTLNLSLKPCSTNQVLQWDGSAWVCAAVGTGTISGVTAGADLTGGGTTGTVTLNLDTTKVPLLNTANAFFGTQTVTGDVNASDAGLDATSISGVASATSGEGWGVYGETDSSSLYAVGVYGSAPATSGSGVGVYGAAASRYGIGTTGQLGPVSAEKSSAVAAGVGAGIWGDTGYPVVPGPELVGIIGTADDAPAGYFQDNSASHTTLVAWNDNAAGYPFLAANSANYASCNVDPAGNLNCSGAKHAVVPIDGGKRKVALSAIESPMNWFEDVGSGHLSNGAAIVQLDSDFIQTVNAEKEYQVFLTPYGDCKGLYVTNRTSNSFEVHELGGGTGAVSFGYRIMALRKNFENIRMEDHTNDPDPMKLLDERKRAGHATPDMKSFTPKSKPAPAMHPIANKAVK